MKQIKVSVSNELYTSLQRAVDDAQEGINEKYGNEIPREIMEANLLEVLLKLGVDTYWGTVAMEAEKGLSQKPIKATKERKLTLIKKGDR